MQAKKIVGLVLIGAACVAAGAQQTSKPDATKVKGQKTERVVVEGKPEVTPQAPPLDSTTEHTLVAGGQTIAYKAIAGTLTVGHSDTFDAMLGLDGKLLADSGMNPLDQAKPEEWPATARMFYTAYIKKDAAPGTRPVMFLYNGGPGSATMWLHMGSFGPKRVVTPDTEHQTAAPYTIVENPYSLLDVTDLVFIDAPGTGFSRIFGKDKEKAFWGVDQDAHAFERFIRRFLTKYDRWNSPKYLFGESYGTPRSAVLSAALHNVDLNGIVLLSAILSFDNSIDGPKANPGVDQAYAVGLPTFAASAYFHHKLPQQPAALEPFLTEVENFAMGEYETALLLGAALPDAQKNAVAEKLHNYTGLSTEYLLKANLRVTGGMFSKQLQDAEGITTGRLDSRYQGPDLDRLSEDAEYDPQSSAISSAYTSAINDYMRTDLKYGRDFTYQPGAYTDPSFSWDMKHTPPGAQVDGSGLNVMPDLAFTMKTNPKMKVMLAGGYYDLATPYFEGKYEMRHLQIPQKLQSNISYKYYPAGHMIYVNDDVLKQFHDDVASFVHSTQSGR